MAKKKHTGPSGLVVVDKPAGMTSHDVVSRVRRLAKTPRVGHAGTLDPMATGVLILGIGKATKLLTYVVGESKTYTATIRLGAATLTDDAQGQVISLASRADMEALKASAIETEIAKLTGQLMQVPSAVSAIKVNGVRSYARVRGGEEVELAARPITVSEFSLHSARLQQVLLTELADGGVEAEADASQLVLDLEVTVSCSAGTYIRALARDLGQALGVGGHLTALRRTRIGQVEVEQAYSLESLAKQVDDRGQLPLLCLEDAAARLFPTRHLSATEATDLSFGRRISPSKTQELTATYSPAGSLLALVENTRFRGKECAAPILVFEAGQTFEERA